NHYERQGILVELPALERAETECLLDEEGRARQRARAQVRAAELDREYVAAFGFRIRELYPRCPEETSRRIAEHACRKHSGRVGRSAAAKALDADAVQLAVVAAIGHEWTNYDALLLEGYERHEARSAVRSQVDAQLRAWQAPS